MDGKKVASNYGFTWKYQIVEYAKLVILSPLARKYGVTEVPSKFLIDEKGKLVSSKSFKEIDSFLEKNLKE